MAYTTEYYQNLYREQKIKQKELEKDLPPFIKAYLHDDQESMQPSTILSYTYDLLRFVSYLRENNPEFKEKIFTVEDFSNLTPEDINEYKLFLSEYKDEQASGNGAAAIAKKLSPLRGLYSYLLKHQMIDKNPMDLVKVPKPKKDKTILYLTASEVNELLDAVEKDTGKMTERQRKFALKTKQRDVAMIRLFLGTGIRVSELVGLDMSALNFKENIISVVRKGGSFDAVYIGEDVKDALIDYITGERLNILKDRADEEPALFISSQKKRISVDAVEKVVEKYANAASLSKHITPHKLRSTFGSAVYNKTGDIELVQHLLGHESPTTTIKHYAGLSQERKKAVTKMDIYK